MVPRGTPSTYLRKNCSCRSITHVAAGGGNDTLNGGNRYDLLVGGAGNDIIDIGVNQTGDRQDVVVAATTGTRVGTRRRTRSADTAPAALLADWNDIYRYLIGSRKGDDKSVGLLVVTD